MLTGVELAGVVLAVFPLVIIGLEHYEEGFQCIKEWIGFRVEFSRFLNGVCRQKIFFRQNIEALLSPIVASEYKMSQLLDSPDSEAWHNAELNEKLRGRLPGVMEYECYMATVSSILGVLEKLKHKLKIVDGQAHWTETHSTAKTIRWEFELKRINYTLSKKRRESFLNELEKQNNDIQNLLGNSERLEPMRRKRKSNIPKFFQRIRNQAYSLHSALCDAWICDCSRSHATKLLLEKRVGKDKIGWVDSNDSVAVKFSVFFCPELEPNPLWYATEIVLAEPSAFLGHKSSQCTESGRRSSSITDTGSRLDFDAMSQGPSTISSGSAKYSRPWDSGSRRVSFLGSSLESAPGDGFEIIDLCSTVKQLPKAPQLLGFLRDRTDQYFAVGIATERKLSSVDTAGVLTLESLLIMTGAVEKKSTGLDIAFPRRTRLKIAVTLANSVLQLHSGPWLPEIWTKQDIYFFRNSDGVINTNHPLVLNHFQSRLDGTSKPVLSPIDFKMQRSHSGNPCLLSLGIVILELWFNQTLESQPFRKDFLGPDGKENEYTNFNTAQKWQEMTMEEAGPDLYNPTRRCVYCAFGAASQDLEDDELRKAVFDEVVQPLERLLERFEGGLVD